MRTKHIIKRLQEDTEYQEFFKKAMAKFDIKSPAELRDPAKKKEFFSWIDANYKGKSEGTGQLKEADNPVHFYITYTDPKKTEMMKAAATKAGMSIKVKVNNPQTDVELTLPGGRYFKMPDAEKMAKILDKLDVEWEDTIGLGFSM